MIHGSGKRNSRFRLQRPYGIGNSDGRVDVSACATTCK
jgi:hypothetical protein